MNVFAFTWTDRLCSQREQCSPVDTEKDVGRFSAAAWWTVRMQGTRPEYKNKHTDTPNNNNAYIHNHKYSKCKNTIYNFCPLSAIKGMLQSIFIQLKAFFISIFCWHWCRIWFMYFHKRSKELQKAFSGPFYHFSTSFMFVSEYVLLTIY